MKKKEEKSFGLISFSYPFDGHFFVPADFKEGFESDKDFDIRTEIIRERLEGISPYIVIGALGYHNPGDFIVEFVQDLKDTEIKKLAFCSVHKVVWGEHWGMGS